MTKRPRRTDGGFTLMTVIVLVVLLGGISAAFMVLSLNESKFTEGTTYKIQATYLAEAGAEAAAFAIRSTVANSQPVALSDPNTDPPQAPSGTIVIDGVAVDYWIQQIGVVRVTTDASGLQTSFQQYEITAQCTSNDTLGRVIRTVDVGATPIFQFLAFYNGDLEFFPGPVANMNGRLHTNSDMYIGANSGMNIRSKHVQAYGEMYRYRKENGKVPGGPLKVQDSSGNLRDWPTSLESTDGNWASESNSIWGGTVKSGTTGAALMETPPVSSLDPGGMFEQNAGLMIKDGTAYVNGSPVSLPSGTITTSSIYDAREGTHVPVTRIDMNKLNSSGYFPPNGLVYAYRTNSSKSSPEGIQLTNASELKSALTVVTNGPAYVQGDYNKTNKKPAAIISDAVNLLSNSWNNSKGPSSGLPSAANTTYNFAMITGNQESTPGSYNGGLENLPRFHERWSGKTATIRGSFVNLGESQIADGAWKYGGNRYTAPNRDWDYDADFDDPSKLPPFTPMVISIARTVYEEGYR